MKLTGAEETWITDGPIIKKFKGGVPSEWIVEREDCPESGIEWARR